MLHRRVKCIFIQAFFIQHYVRPHNAAAGVAACNAFLCRNIIQFKRLPAFQAVIFVKRPMQFQNVSAPSPLVQVVNILCDNSFQLAILLQLCQRPVAVVRLRVRIKQCFFVIFEKYFRAAYKKAVAEYHLRPYAIFVNRLKNAVFTAEIRNTALRRYARAAKKHNVFAFINPFLQLLIFFIHAIPSCFSFYFQAPLLKGAIPVPFLRRFPRRGILRAGQHAPETRCSGRDIIPVSFPVSKRQSFPLPSRPAQTNEIRPERS